MEKKVSCNFIGHLENENTACVAVTGCPGEEMAFTIKSKHSEHIGYILHQDGQLESVESTFKVLLIWNYNHCTYLNSIEIKISMIEVDFTRTNLASNFLLEKRQR